MMPRSCSDFFTTPPSSFFFSKCRIIDAATMHQHQQPWTTTTLCYHKTTSFLKSLFYFNQVRWYPMPIWVPGRRRTRSAGIISETGVQQWTVPVITLPYLTYSDSLGPFSLFFFFKKTINCLVNALIFYVSTPLAALQTQTRHMQCIVDAQSSLW